LCCIFFASDKENRNKKNKSEIFHINIYSSDNLNSQNVALQLLETSCQLLPT
jgi:hypothetical protein